jgi:hypothetical protein
MHATPCGFPAPLGAMKGDEHLKNPTNTTEETKKRYGRMGEKEKVLHLNK